MASSSTSHKKTIGLQDSVHYHYLVDSTKHLCILLPAPLWYLTYTIFLQCSVANLVQIYHDNKAIKSGTASSNN